MASWLAARKRNCQLYFEDWCSIRFLTSSRVNRREVVSKRTAIQLAFALRLSREEADLLLHTAGYHLSRSVIEDIIFDACLEAKIHSLEDVNQLLVAHECRPFVPQA